MSDKKITKKENNTINNPSNTTDMLSVFEKKIEFFKDVIQKTAIHAQQLKVMDILGVSEMNECIDKLGELSIKISEIVKIKITDTNNIINELQYINNELSSLFKLYGTTNLDDMLVVCFGNNAKITNTDEEYKKFELIRKYFHPTGYKVYNKDSKLNKHDNNLTCYDLVMSHKQFHMKVYGLKLYLYCSNLKKSLIVFGMVDDIIVDYLNNSYISAKIESIKLDMPNDKNFDKTTFNNYLLTLNLKDYLVFDNHIEIYNKYIGGISQRNTIRQKNMSLVTKEFLMDDMYNKRSIIMSLLINTENYDDQYFAYLLYHLLSNESNGTVDTHEQTVLFNSFPWKIKQYFKESMKKTNQYTNQLSNFDMNKIPLEQQICLMKVDDSVKEKAMMKLKEVKAKSEDSGSKARQYLDGLLKIPFGVYKKEPILYIMSEIKQDFKNMITNNDMTNLVSLKEKFTSVEIRKYVGQIQEEYNKNNSICILKQNLSAYFLKRNRKELKMDILKINEILEKRSISTLKNITSQSKKELIVAINTLMQMPEVCSALNDEFLTVVNQPKLHSDLKNINGKLDSITSYIKDVKSTLDNAVYGHDKAKKQVERIIGQWINGELDGYCFGFEGPPGVGKTSLAKKGLSDCLKDENGNSRPFAMIQMGGDSNGSTLHGHNYTYVGSTWGSIVQILIDKKCMNPIIFIDEVDKISRTENGKEIIGILTHLLDPAQNDCFQDKYFNGIDLDLSKALFILSYNDASAIDRILLDRVHRIQFKNLSVDEKLVICNKHILPEIYKKMGLENMIHFDDVVLKFIIEEYTHEAGVRKLKEILFEIIGEINLDILKGTDNIFTKSEDFPIHITVDNVKHKYFKDKREIIVRKVFNKSKVGFVNGMYATIIGSGGTLPIHAMFYPSTKFMELKLTGLQQEVMRESMHISLTVAWNLTPIERQIRVRELYNDDKNRCGINVHTGDGGIQKDGPSAGCAITCVLYSLLNDLPIKSEFGITGEIQLSGEVTAIGGLDSKILGSLKAGVKSFIYPHENKKDFDEFYEKYKNAEILEGISFYPINNVEEALELIIEK